MRISHFLLLSAASTLSFSCGGGALVTDAGEPPSAVRIISLSASRTQLAPGDSTVLTAVLTALDGGATSGLVVRGERTAASFSQQPNQQWTASAGFPDLIAATDNEGPDKLAPISVEATFFDERGLPVRGALDLQLTCGDASQALCGGRCVDARTAENCGTCGHACTEMPVVSPGSESRVMSNVSCAMPGSAQEPRCGTFGFALATGPGVTCARVCANLTAHGRSGRCVPRCLWGSFSYVQFNGGSQVGQASYGPSYDSVDVVPLDCDWQPPASVGPRDFRGLNCCCEF